jgi:acetyl-CoA carboxylase carboxyl transferase subunit alpha
LGMGVGDVIAMLEHSYYSVISPEGCASILWKDARQNAQAAASLKMHAEDLLQLKIIDSILEEPLGGAHHDPAAVFHTVKRYILEQWERLKDVSPDALLEMRYRKFRGMGKFTTADNTVAVAAIPS